MIRRSIQTTGLFASLLERLTVLTGCGWGMDVCGLSASENNQPKQPDIDRAETTD